MEEVSGEDGSEDALPQTTYVVESEEETLADVESHTALETELTEETEEESVAPEGLQMQ